MTMETTKKVPLIIMTMLTTNNCQRRSSHLIIAMQLKKDRSCCEILESITSMSDVNLFKIRHQTKYEKLGSEPVKDPSDGSGLKEGQWSMHGLVQQGFVDLLRSCCASERRPDCAQHAGCCAEQTKQAKTNKVLGFIPTSEQQQCKVLTI